ncbi:hypothetical protein LCGC14_0848570 [marine sediment metagenome]|uniref:Uncharacterized protein n=1 Tax=marine sediment metagenome TaxID=412755 RepID=A0A0F9RVS1_9ZZZZ
MGFTLRIINAPHAAAKWNGNFAENSFNYTPTADSGWLNIEQAWDYPSDPRGVTTLRVWVIDFQNNTLIDTRNLGPVDEGGEYEFNCVTKELEGVTVEPPPVVTLPFLDLIVGWLVSVSDFFYEAYLEVNSWVWPFRGLAFPLHLIYRAFFYVAHYFGVFAEYMVMVATRIVQIFSLEQITAYLQNVIDAAFNAWDWISNAFGNVWNIIDDWWTAATLTVQGWIEIATEGFTNLKVLWDEFWVITWPRWTATLAALGSQIGDFFTNTLPDLLSYLKLENWWNGKLFAIDGLIGSKIVEWFPFYDNLVEIWNDIVEFFSDPGEFLLSRLADWFLGPEE